MGKLPDWIGNFPFPADKKKPIVITRSQTKQFIYPDKPENSDYNWNYASTDKFFIAQYQLSPGVKFMPIAGPQARKEPVNSMLISEKDKLAVIWGEEYPVLLKFLVSNDLVHMAEFFLPAGGLSPRCSEAHSHQGDEATYVCEGDLVVFFPDTNDAMEVRPQEVIFIPEGVNHQYINYSDQVVKAVKAVAPGL